MNAYNFSIIQKSQLEGAHRMDAEFYQPEYFIDFSVGNWERIGDILEQCQYGISLAMNEEGIGYPIFKMNDINHGFLLDDEIKYVPLQEQIFQGFKLKRNDVLFNRVNSEEFVGRTGIYKLAMDSVFASYLIRIRPNKNIVTPDYLNIFLNSSFGIRQIRKFARRAVNQANVNAEELKEIRILIAPKSFQNEISILSDDAWASFEESKRLYAQAEDLLLEELGLKDVKFGEDLAYLVKFSDIKTAGRMDADYFQPKYEKLLEFLKKYGAKELSETVENVSAKFDSAKKPQDIFKYVELSNINASLGIIDGYSEVSGKEAPSRAKRVLKAGDVIVSSIEGSLEKSALVDREREGFLASTGFFQFRSKEILSEVLLVMAKSIVFQWQLRQKTAGTILTAVPKESINGVLIPTIPKLIQQKIADLVRQSHEARKKSKELLESAKRKVEELIERGGTA